MEEVLKELGIDESELQINISKNALKFITNRIIIKGREYYLPFMDCLKEM